METIKINFIGGIISPGELYDILAAAYNTGIRYVRFGLRQQLFIDVSPEKMSMVEEELHRLNVFYEAGKDEFPNTTSSYAAEEVFIRNTWLSEGVYKDILDAIDYTPRLKINISDSNQSFTPMLTGNINWVASSDAPHFWHLFIRFPKTNIIYEWAEMVYTNDVARISRHIEQVIFNCKDEFYDNSSATGRSLFEKIATDDYITKPAEKPAVLPPFNLPYYEGLNRYNNKYWLGIYRRDELFSISFLIELCRLALATKIGQICSTPWKSVIVKGIDEKDKPAWNRLLEKHQINMRHAANELNFQVEENCRQGLHLKNYLVKSLNNDDTRTFGVCIGIKTRKKSEVFSSILVRRKALISFLGIELFYLYDILCAHNFNPNERTGFVFSANNPKFLLGEQLRRCILTYYDHRKQKNIVADRELYANRSSPKAAKDNKKVQYVYQCRHCLTVYDDPNADQDSDRQVDAIPNNHNCSLCDAPAADFFCVDASALGLKSA